MNKQKFEHVNRCRAFFVYLAPEKTSLGFSFDFRFVFRSGILSIFHLRALQKRLLGMRRLF